MTNEPKEIDHLSGVETTGHEWDGLKELNNPAPLWWLWIFYATVIWSIGYWILYPAWPTLSGATKGVLGTNQYKQLAQSQDEIAARQAVFLEKFEPASFAEIQNDPALRQFALAGGASAFKDNCATCHGTGAEGSRGYPNLNDDDWIWGGTVEDIYQTLRYGIRSGHDETHTSFMPAFGRDKLLTSAEIQTVTKYMLSWQNDKNTALDPNSETYTSGAEIFATNCASCHGETGAGGRDFGAPNLRDAIWLYGGTLAEIQQQIVTPKHGVMPAWENRLSDATLRQLAIYVHGLGGGEATVAPQQAEPVPAAEEGSDVIINPATP